MCSAAPTSPSCLPPVPDTQLSLPRKWTTQVQHKFINPQQPLLAHDKVRHVGEAVAVILAESRYAAEDAAQLVSLDLDPLPAVVDPEAALRAGAPMIHDKFATNLIGAFTIGKGDVDAALARAPHKLKRRFHHHRYAAAPMECRGVVGVHDPRTDSVTIWSATQVVHWVRREAASVLRLPEARVRCLALDVGGGFGLKGHVYPEDLLIPFLARRLGRPVQWIEDRREHLMCSCHSRDQIHDVEVGFDGDGRILALRDRFHRRLRRLESDRRRRGLQHRGASARPLQDRRHRARRPDRRHQQGAERALSRGRAPGSRLRDGAGDRSRGRATLGLEPAEVRLRNMIRADEMPYRVGIPYRDGEPIVYDGGDYPAALHKALAAIGGVAAFRARQRAARGARPLPRSRHRLLRRGHRRRPVRERDGADRSVRQDLRVVAAPARRARAWRRSSPRSWPTPGRSIRTTWSWRSPTLPRSSIGFGTIASRSTVTLSAAIHGASDRLRAKVFAIAANVLECAAADLELRNGAVGIVGVPGAELPLARLAQAARPGWDHGRPRGHRCRAGGDLLLRAADGDLVLRGACGDRGGRHRARARAHRELCHRP